MEFKLVRWIETDENSGKGILCCHVSTHASASGSYLVEQLSHLLASSGSEQRARVRRSLERALNEIDLLAGKR